MIICLFCLNYDIVGIIKDSDSFCRKMEFFFLLEKRLCIDLFFFILNLKKRMVFVLIL